MGRLLLRLATLSLIFMTASSTTARLGVMCSLNFQKDDPTCAADGLAFCVSSDDCYPSGPTGAGSQQTVCNAPGEPPGFTVYNWKSTSKCKGKAPSAFYSGE